MKPPKEILDVIETISRERTWFKDKEKVKYIIDYLSGLSDEDLIVFLRDKTLTPNWLLSNLGANSPDLCRRVTDIASKEREKEREEKAAKDKNSKVVGQS